MPEDPINVLDLFAGAGGFSQGFQQAGFRVVAANEIWQPAADTYMTNHPDIIMFRGDITSPKVKKDILDFFKDKPCDVIIGGPPCQAYSMAGLRLPTDPRGKLFRDYLKIVKALKPKIFVMENVKGLLYIKVDKHKLKPEQLKKTERIKRLKKEKTELLLKKVRSKNTEKVIFTARDATRFAYLIDKIPKLEKKVASYQKRLVDVIVNKIWKLGYKVEYKVLNAANYSVPQVRERIVFIATRYDVPIQFPPEICTQWVSVKDAIDDLKDVGVNGKINLTFAQHGSDFMRKVRKTHAGKTALRSYKSSFKRLNPIMPSPTVKENHGAVFVHYEKDRVLNPRELARLQSFDDSFFFCSAKRDVLIQIGNAVPPLLAFAVAKSVKAMLSNIHGQGITFKNVAKQNSPLEMLNQ